MKKFVAGILTLAFVCTLSFSTVGCGDKKTTKSSGATETKTTTVTSEKKTGGS